MKPTETAREASNDKGSELTPPTACLPACLPSPPESAGIDLRAALMSLAQAGLSEEALRAAVDAVLRVAHRPPRETDSAAHSA
jgi:hypothetical protein